jgi:tRNA-specific 2-thiouridylase
VRFPLGDLTKPQVRELARAARLAVADRRESQDLCFLAGTSRERFLRRHAGVRDTPGDVVDTRGRVLGRHRGHHRFTVGQRKGLGLSSPIPLYVVDLDAGAGTVTVGPREALLRSALTASGVNWIAGRAPEPGTRVTAQIRYRHREAPARVTAIEPDRVEVLFDEPQSAVAPGQAVVFYQADVVVGGGWID